MSGVARPGPQQEERLARYRAGAMPASERAAFEREALADDALAEALYSEESLEALRLPARRQAPWGALALAASVMVVAALALLWLRPPPGPAPDAGETLRGEQPGGDPAAAAAPLAPVGPLAAAPDTFRWRRDPGAHSYRLEVYDPQGVLLVGAVLRDTSAAAARLGADTLRAGAWRVVPIGADGAERPARPAVSFTRVGR